MRYYFEIPITFKIGVETFDYDCRNGYLNKNAKFKTVEELKELLYNKKYGNFLIPCFFII